MKEKKISVIIPTCNRLCDLNRLITSLEQQTISITDVIIADQSTNEDTKNFIKDYKKNKPFLKLRYIHLKEQSLTRAKNIAIELLDKNIDFVAFFDDDIILTPIFFEEVINFFQKDKNEEFAVAVGCIINKKFKKNAIYYLRYVITALFFLPYFGNGKFKINGFPTYYLPDIHKEKVVEVISGGASVFKKKILDAFKFDDNMKEYCYMEDVDAGYRISRKYKNIILPNAKLYHNCSNVNRSNLPENRSQYIQNYIYLFNKNIPKNPITISVYIWSILGLFIYSLFTKNPLNSIRMINGYINGIFKTITNKYDTLYNDWRDKIDNYKGF